MNWLVADQALEKISHSLATGELDGSGRFFTDEELAAGTATDELKKKPKPEAASAA